jgi:hypothetical protein
MCKSREPPLHQPSLISKNLIFITQQVTTHYLTAKRIPCNLIYELTFIGHVSWTGHNCCTRTFTPYLLDSSPKKFVHTWRESTHEIQKRTNSIWRCDTAFPYFPRWTGESHCCSYQEGKAERELSKLRHFHSVLFFRDWAFLALTIFACLAPAPILSRGAAISPAYATSSFI